MKAFVITEPGKSDFCDLPIPAPGQNEVLVEVKAVGFCGSDLNTFRGTNPMVTYPRVPGHEVGGIIQATGKGVSAAWSPGTQVLVSPYTSCGQCAACVRKRFNCCEHNQTLGVQRDGAMTQYIVVPQEKLFTSPQLSLSELAMVEPLTVGFHAVDRARVTAEDVVAVFGCGAIGLGAISGAAARQAKVIAIDIDDSKLALAGHAGAEHVINTSQMDLHAQLRKLTQNKGPDVMIEAVGLPQTFLAAVEEVAYAGRVVYIGYAKKPVEYETRLFVQKELDILGSRNALPDDFLRVIAMLEARQFPVAQALTRSVALDEAGDALAQWSDNPSAVTKMQVMM